MKRDASPWGGAQSLSPPWALGERTKQRAAPFRGVLSLVTIILLKVSQTSLFLSDRSLWILLCKAAEPSGYIQTSFYVKDKVSLLIPAPVPLSGFLAVLLSLG